MPALETAPFPALASPLASMAAPGADAAVAFTLTRISDTEATLTGSGTPDVGLDRSSGNGDHYLLEVEDLFDRRAFNEANGEATQSGEFQFGANAIATCGIIEGDLLTGGF